ncbi:MAG: hypothetical protein ACREJO_00715 [Phycisphaerales bacterium]
MTRPLVGLLSIPALGTLAAALLIASCGEEKSAPTASVSGVTLPARAPDQTYTVRGKIEELPIPGKRRSELRVHHEAIDTFTNGEGKLVGMGAMVMEFPPAKGLSLEGFAVKDTVELTFSVWWDQGAASWFATKLTKLPADTKLTFGPAKPSPSPK